MKFCDKSGKDVLENGHLDGLASDEIVWIPVDQHTTYKHLHVWNDEEQFAILCKILAGHGDDPTAGGWLRANSLYHHQ